MTRRIKRISVNALNKTINTAKNDNSRKVNLIEVIGSMLVKQPNSDNNQKAAGKSKGFILGNCIFPAKTSASHETNIRLAKISLKDINITGVGKYIFWNGNVTKKMKSPSLILNSISTTNAEDANRINISTPGTIIPVFDL